MESLDAVPRASLARSPANEVDPWANKGFVPPPGIAIGTSLEGGLARATREIDEVDRGRPMHRIVYDGNMRVLPLRCLGRVTS